MVEANLLVTHEPSHAGSAKEEVEKALWARKLGWLCLIRMKF
mgnify:CR=1 FL=1